MKECFHCYLNLFTGTKISLFTFSSYDITQKIVKYLSAILQKPLVEKDFEPPQKTKIITQNKTDNHYFTLDIIDLPKKVIIYNMKESTLVMRRKNFC